MATMRNAGEITMVDARRDLTKLPERLESRAGPVTVTRRGKPVLAIMAWEDYEAILETLEILSDKDAVQQLRRSIREVKSGKAIPWEKAKGRLA